MLVGDISPKPLRSLPLEMAARSDGTLKTESERKPTAVTSACLSAVPVRWEYPVNAPHSPGHYRALSYPPLPAYRQNRLSVSVPEVRH